MKKKLAIVSNINMDYVGKLLEAEFVVFHTEGYGEVFEALFDTESALNHFSPDVFFFFVDIEELAGNLEIDAAEGEIKAWFENFRANIREDKEYFIADPWHHRLRVEDLDESGIYGIFHLWRERQIAVCAKANVHRFSMDFFQETGGKVCFSDKLWYTGGMSFSSQGCGLIAEQVRKSMSCLHGVHRKVLVLDLDNTLWGGILGECGPDGIILSEQGMGAIYRDAQKLLVQMKKRGVLLAICSKNNENDVEEVFSRHPGMVLKRDDFVARYINWKEKSENISAMAQRLNLGLDTFVFVDDSPREREAVRMMFPEVAVPEFPDAVEKIPSFFVEIWEQYFKKGQSTQEDRERTCLYRGQEKREILRASTDYESYLASLELKTERIEISEAVKERMVQMMQRTNQFNMTLRRYDGGTLRRKLDCGFIPYVFRISDRFGSYGISAFVLVEPERPEIDVFLLSCRAMGKRLEHTILKFVEEDLKQQGFRELWAEFIMSEKNKPASGLYSQMGYSIVKKETGRIVYRKSLIPDWKKSSMKEMAENEDGKVSNYRISGG